MKYNVLGSSSKGNSILVEDFLKLQRENKQLKSQLDYLRSGEYYNQLRFERDMLQDLVDNNEISKENKEFIDYTYKNTELLSRIDKAIEYITSEEYFFLNNQKTGSFFEDSNNYMKAHDKLLEILKGDSNE